MMIEAKIQKIKWKALAAKITPKIKNQFVETSVVGFDTEYDSKTSELISFQLSCGPEDKQNILIEVLKGEILTPRWLYHEACKLLHAKPRHITFITYFSAAELQFLPVLEEGFNIMEYTRGFMDCDFQISPKTAVTFFDASRWLDGQPLSEAAKSFGLEKYEYNTKKVTRRCLNDPKFVEYAKHDAYLCYQIVQDLRKVFLTECGVEPLKVKTPASAAAETFRNLYVTEDIYNDCNEAKILSMRGTWGGRAEVFKRGRFDKCIHEYDLNGAYANSAISLEKMPSAGDWKMVSSFTNLKQCIGGFGRVLFTFPKSIKYPVIPVFCEKEGCMIYPLEGESYCTFDEILYAKELGAKIKIIEAYGYKTGTTILKEFSEWTLKKKSESTAALKVMYKLIANSLYGKMNQGVSKINLNEYLRILDDNPDFLLDELLSLSKYELMALGARESISLGSVSMPEWFGLITGRIRSEVGRMLNSCDPYYCHTDSVWTRTKPKTKYLQFEKKFTGPATVIRARFAGMGDFKSLKRVKDGKGKIAFHSIWNATAACQMLTKFNGEDFSRKYPVRRPLRFHEAVRQGKKPGQWVTEYRCGNTLWDQKRKLMKNGNTRPFKDVFEFKEHYLRVKTARKELSK